MSSPEQPRIRPLTRAHDRKGFSCGNEMLDRYLHTQARQDIQRRVAQVYVLLDEDQRTILGYHTLSNSSVLLSDLPEELRRRLPRYPKIPVTLLGRLAVAARCQGQGFGRLLLVDALRRSARQATEIASAAVIVDAIDESAVKFYQRYHFLALPETPRTLFLEMATIQKLFE
ncbi:MAG: GNAT family N-acetyltransferase [Chloroflexota bacterium]|nr:GNAT family N-acetyltransferase [Chloroflexota bacterium]